MTAGQRPRVLVTRPEPGADATAQRLEAIGFHPVVLPLTRTMAVVPSVPVNPDAVDAVAATSANALRLAQPQWLRPLLSKPLFAVGGSTAAAARSAGFQAVHDAEGDARGLAHAVLAQPAIGRVAYLCGRVRRPDFEAALRAGGVAVEPVETYDTAAIRLDARAIDAALCGIAAHAVLLHSLEGARAFRGLLGLSGAKPLLEKAAVFALAPRLLEGLPGTAPGFAPPLPNEALLLALLVDWARSARPPLFSLSACARD